MEQTKSLFFSRTLSVSDYDVTTDYSLRLAKIENLTARITSMIE